MEKLEKIVDFLKLLQKLSVIILITCGCLLFLPETFIEKLYLIKFKNDYSSYIGFLFLLSSVFVADSIWKYLKNKWYSRNVEKKTHRTLMELDEKEKAVLREFYLQNQNTIFLPINDSIVAGLIDKRILRLVSSIGQSNAVDMLFPLTMTEAARKNITPEIVGLKKDKPSKADIEFVINNRPKYIKQINEYNKLMKSIFEP